MSLTAEIPGLSMKGLRICEIEVVRRVGSAATAHFCFDAALVDSQDIPDPATLCGKPLTIRAHSSVEIIDNGRPPVFAGSVIDVAAEFWAPDRLRVTVQAMEGPLSCSFEHDQRAAWLSFAKDRPLKDAMKVLLEAAGFGDVRFVKAVEDKLPSGLLCPGAHPYYFLQSVGYVHGVALAARPSKDGTPQLALVRTAGELADLGTTRTIALGQQAGSYGLRTAEQLCVLHRQRPAEAGVSFWDAATEKFGIAGPKERRSRRPAMVKDSVAKKMQEWQKARDRARDVLVRVITNDPEISIGDRLDLVGAIDTAKLDWLANRLSGEALHVIGVTLRLNSSEAQLVTTTIDAVPASAPAMSWSQTSPFARDHSEPGTLMLSGEVVEMPPGQGKMKVALDVTDLARPEIHCDWMSPCLSGEGGGLHMPPLPGDRVKLLCESVPYGRIIYLGAVGGNQRLSKLREAVAGHHETARPTNDEGKGEPPIPIKSDHLTRFLGASPTNISAWSSPGSGMSSDASEDEASQCSILSSGTHQLTRYARPGLDVVHHSGSGAIYEKKLEGSCLIESTANVEINAKESFKLEAKNTTLKTREAFSASAGQTAELKSPATTVKGDNSVTVESNTSATLSGGTVAIKGQSLIDQKATLIKLNS